MCSGDSPPVRACVSPESYTILTGAIEASRRQVSRPTTKTEPTPEASLNEHGDREPFPDEGAFSSEPLGAPVLTASLNEWRVALLPDSGSGLWLVFAGPTGSGAAGMKDGLAHGILARSSPRHRTKSVSSCALPSDADPLKTPEQTTSLPNCRR